MFGLRAYPGTVALQRLQISSTGTTSDVFDPTQLECFWTDGSVPWGNYFWLSTGAYAIVDSSFRVVESGRVNRWELLAYTTELFTLLRVIKRARCCIQVRSDCQSVVGQFYTLCQTLQVPSAWSHQVWWREICQILTQRSQLCASPIVVFWTPSHLLEHLPSELITEAARDIIANRCADREAHWIATEMSPIHPRDQRLIESAVTRRHEWLVMLNWLLETTQPSPNFAHGPKASTDNAASVISRFPHWTWSAPIADFPWKPAIFTRQTPPAGWSFDDDDWRDCRLFLQNLRWKPDPSSCVATTELACLYWCRGHRHTQLEAGVSFYHHLILIVRVHTD